MRIKCKDVDDFLKNLSAANMIWNNVIYYDRSKVADTEISTALFYQLSCVIEFVEGQALLECGVKCGNDLHTSDGHTMGTDKQLYLHQKMVDYVDDNSKLKFLPGILDM